MVTRETHVSEHLSEPIHIRGEKLWRVIPQALDQITEMLVHELSAGHFASLAKSSPGIGSDLEDHLEGGIHHQSSRFFKLIGDVLVAAQKPLLG